MKSVVIILFIFCCRFASGQSDSLNKVDAMGLKQGKWIQYYDNGSKRYEGTFKDDKQIGIFTYYDKEGFINMLLYNKKDGITQVANAYHSNGRILAMGLYRHQKKDSVWQYYNEKEALVATETYKNGGKHGMERSYYPSGQLAGEINWVNNKKEGATKEYFDDGTLKYEGSYVSDKLEGAVVYYYKSGKKKVVGHYKQNVRDGLWKEYYEDGLPKAQRLYSKGHLIKTQIDNAPYKEYYKSMRLREEGNYKNSKKNGPFIVYYDTGEVKKVYVEPNPEKAEVGGMTEKVEGRKIKMKGNYKDGKMDGLAIYFTIKGEVEKKEMYRDGVLIETR